MRENRLVGYLVLGLLTFSILYAALWGNRPIRPAEIRVYGLLLLFILASTSFAILRLYNAVVQNTALLIKVRKQVQIFNTRVVRLGQEFVGSARLVKTAMNNADGASDKLTAAIKELIRVLKRQD